MGRYWGLAIALLAAAMLSLVGALLVSTEAGAVVVVDHDWRITSTTYLSNEEYEVHGNLTVQAHSVLYLDNARITIVGTGNGSHRLEVEEMGMLIAADSTIEGSPHTIGVHVNGSTTMDRCLVQNLERAGQSLGLHIALDLVMRNTTVRACPNGTAVTVGFKLDAFDCTFEDLGNRALVMPSNNGILTMVNCELSAGTAVAGDTVGLQLDWTPAVQEYTRVLVKGCEFSDFTYGVQALANSTATIMLDACQFSYCQNGVVLRGNRARAALVDCLALGPGPGNGYLVDVVRPDLTPFNLTVRGLVAEGFEHGIRVMGPAIKFQPTLTNVTVVNCGCGVRALGSTVYVEDSNVTLCTVGFWAENKARIEIRRTVHDHRSGYVPNNPMMNAAVVAFSTVNITSCRWRDGHVLESGVLHLFGDDGIELDRQDLAELQPKEIVAWSKTKYNDLGRLYLIPTLILDGVHFEAVNFSVYNTSAQDVEIVDHLPPVIDEVWPTADHWFNYSRPNVTGHLVERGSGLADMVARIVDGQELRVDVRPDGNWSMTFDPVVDGPLVIELQATDRTGGTTLWMVDQLFVDTRVPSIELEQDEWLSNTTQVIVVGTTEGHCHVRVWEEGVPPGTYGHAEGETHSDAMGGFYFTLLLLDGTHDISIASTDRAGNGNASLFQVRVDTKVPSVHIEEPQMMDWLNTSTVDVSFQVSDDGTSGWVRAWIEVGDQTVEDTGTGITVELEEGTRSIWLVAKDEAGNIARTYVEVFVDLTPPVLDIVTPAEGRFFTKELKVNLQGEVYDENLEGVDLNGLPLDVLEGIFTGVLQIEEGENRFNITARDMAGNLANRTIVVLRDLTPPEWSLEIELVDGTVFEVGTVRYGTLDGDGPARIEAAFQVSEWSRVTVAGGLGQVEGKGSLGLVLDLAEGENSFTFNIEDEAGNLGSPVTYRIVLDTTAPEITIDDPREGQRTTKKVYRVRGRVEAGSSLSIDGQDVPVNPDGTFSVQVDLRMGENTLTLEATDRVGLKSDTQLTIKRREEPEDGPGSGALAALSALALASLVALGARRVRRG